MSEQSMVRIVGLHRVKEEVAAEWSALWQSMRGPALVWWWRRRVLWRVEAALLAWTEDAEPSAVADLRYLAEADDGDWLMPWGLRDGCPYWEGVWCWWRPTHWPAYLRSRRARTYVMVEKGWIE